MLGATLLTQAVPAHAQQTFRFDIPRGDLAAVVAGISRATGRPITLPATLASERVAGPIRGSTSIEEALSRALAGTGLRAVAVDSGSFNIRDAVATTGATTPSADLAAIDVNDTGGGQYNDQGFQAGDAGETVRLANAPLREIPLTVNIVTQKVIESQVITDVVDATRNVPGVSKDQGATTFGSFFNIRGFNNDSQSTTIDGRFKNGLAFIPIDDVERVEVLKGPTSILTGQTALGGVVNIVTKAPTSERIRTIVARYGTGNYKTLATDLGGTIEGTEGLTFRFVASGNHADENYAGYRDLHETIIAPSLRWQGQDLTIAAGLRYIDQHTANSSSTVVSPLDDGTGLDIVQKHRHVPIGNKRFGADIENLALWTKQSYDLGRFFGSDISINNDFRYVNENLEFIQLGVRSSIPPASHSILPFRFREHKSNTGILSDRSDITAKYDSELFNNTLKIGYDYEPTYSYNLSTIAHYKASDHYDIDLLSGRLASGYYAPNKYVPYKNSFKYNYEINGYYFVDKVDLLDKKLHLFGSLRYDDFQQNTRIRRGTLPVNQIGGGDTGISWIAGAAYDLAPWLTIYGNRGNGFSPSGNVNEVSRKMYPSEQREISEVGARYYLFDKRITFTTAFFDAIRNNVTFEDPDDPLKYTLVKGVENTGMEIDAQGEIMPGLNLIGAYSIVEPKLQDQRSGIGLAGIPKHMSSVWATYRFQSSALDGWSIGAGYQSVGSSVATSGYVQDGAFRIKGYETFDAMIGYEKDDLSIQFKINNIFDRLAYEPTIYSQSLMLLRGRNFTVQTAFKF